MLSPPLLKMDIIHIAPLFVWQDGFFLLEYFDFFPPIATIGFLMSFFPPQAYLLPVVFYGNDVTLMLRSLFPPVLWTHRCSLNHYPQIILPANEWNVFAISIDPFLPSIQIKTVQKMYLIYLPQSAK